jgi:hypothetical protein
LGGRFGFRTGTMRNMTSRGIFRLEEFFVGRISGWGFTHSRFGKLQNDFTIEAEGLWDGARNRLSLTEDYRFSDGHRDRLNWDIEKTSQHRYSGMEARLVGKAQGEQSEQSFRWRYRRSVPAKNGSTATLAFDDCFLWRDEDVVIARAAVSKLGFQIATITVFYLRRN